MMLIQLGDKLASFSATILSKTAIESNSSSQFPEKGIKAIIETSLYKRLFNRNETCLGEAVLKQVLLLKICKHYCFIIGNIDF